MDLAREAKKNDELYKRIANGVYVLSVAQSSSIEATLLKYSLFRVEKGKAWINGFKLKEGYVLPLDRGENVTVRTEDKGAKLSVIEF